MARRPPRGARAASPLIVHGRQSRVAYGPFQLGTLPRGVVEEVQAKVLREQIKMAP